VANPNDQQVDAFLQRAITGNQQPINSDRATANISTARAAPDGFLETFGAGIRSGGEGMVGDLEYFKALGNTLLGDEESAAKNVQDARIKAEFAANPLSDMETFGEFVKAPTVGGFLDQVVLGTGQITPSIASSIATGFTGVLAAVAGKAALGVGAKATARKLTQDAIEKRGRGEALDEAEEEYLNASYDLFSKETLKYGGISGMVAGELPLMAGGAVGEFDEAGEDLNVDRALQALLIGSAQTAVSVGGEVLVLSKLAKLAKTKGVTQDSFLPAVAKGAAKGIGISGATEGTTEVIQEGISIAQRMSVDDTYTWEQAQLRLGQAAFVGFFGGGAPGGLGGAVAGGFSNANSERIFSKAAGMLEDKTQAEVAGEIDEARLGLDPTGNFPAAESQADIEAQLTAVIDPDSAKQAAWIPSNSSADGKFDLDESTPDNQIVSSMDNGTELFAARIPGRGVIVSKDKALVEEIIKSGASEESLRVALGYSAGKTGDQVVRVKDSAGNVISEQATDAEGLDAAVAAAEKISGSNGFRTVDVVSSIQALEDRKARRSPLIRNMSGNTEVDEVDPNEQDGSFTTEAQERELSEGFNEVDETQTEDVADYGLGSPDNRSDPTTFENNWAAILGLVPTEERAKIAAMESVASESFARQFLEYLKNDPGYYSVDQRGDRLFITREPDSADTFLSGSTKQETAEQRESSIVKKLLDAIKRTGTIKAATANKSYFFRGQKNLRRRIPKNEKVDPTAPREELKQTVGDPVFTAQRPDGSSTPMRIGDVIAAGQQINVGSQTAVVGETLSPDQAAKAGLLRGLAILAEQGIKVSFFGKPLNFTLDTARVALSTASTRAQVFGDLKNSRNELAQMSASAKTQITSRQWAASLDGPQTRIFDDLIIFQSGGKEFSLRDLVNTKDPIPLESKVADEKQIKDNDEARARVEKRIDDNPNLLKYVTPMDLLEEELGRAKDRELGFSPADIIDTAETEPAIGFQSPSESLTPDADALKRMSNWRNEELQRQREAMNAGTRPVVTPAALEAEIDAQLPAKREEFLAEAKAKLLQTPSGTNSETQNSFTGSGTTVGGSIEILDPIEQQQLQAAKDAGVLDADKGVDLNARNRTEVDSQGDRAEESTDLDEIRFRRENKLLGLSPEQIKAREEARLEEQNNPAGLEPDIHPSRLVMENAPQMGGFNQVQSAAQGTIPNRPINPGRQQFIQWRATTGQKIRPSEVQRLTQVFGDIGAPANRVLAKALKIFRQQLSKPLKIYSRSEYIKQNTATIKNQFDKGEINLAEMNIRLGKLATDLADGNYGTVIPYANSYVIILQDTFADGDTAGAEARMAAVLGHEIGHVIFDAEVKRLADAGGVLMDSLMKAFQKDLLEKDVTQYDGQGGFEEWYADQVASYLYDSAKRATNGAESYFKRIAAKMRELFQAVNEFLDGRLTANKDFRKYINDVVEANRKNIKLYNDLTGGSHLDAIDKMAVRNWNGKVFDHVPEKAATSAKNAFEKIMRSGAGGFFMKWLTASDNYLRSMGKYGVELAKFWQATSQSGERSGFHHDKQRNENIFLQKLAKAMGVNPNRADLWATDEINEILQEAEDETIDTADLKDPRSKAVRKVFEDFHATYLQDEQGRPYFQVRQRKNYAPRLINFHGLEETPEMRESLAQLLVKYPNTQKTDEFGEFQLTIQQARKLVDEILADPTENPEVAQNAEYSRRKMAALAAAQTPEERAQIEKDFEQSEQEARDEDRGHIAPGFRNSLARSLGAIPTKELRAIDALAPPVLAFTQYFHHATRRVEFEKRGGEAEINRIIDLLPEEHKEDARNAVRANLGRVGIGSKPWVRKLNSVDAVWTSTTTLLFTAFTSFTDMAGPIVRSKDFAGMSRAFSELNKTLSTNENQELTRAIGVASAEAAANIFMAAGELDYANSTARKILDKFFRYSGLQLYTRFSREFAAGMGREFLLDIANRDQSDTTQRWLDELEISQEQILKWDSGDGSFDTPEGRAVAKAIAKFVDESIVRPNAAERPLWASHPMAMVVWRLKSYFYSFGKVILGGMGREMKNRYREDGDFRGAGMVLALALGAVLPLAALGLEMKELTKYMLQALLPGLEASGRTFRSDHMNAPEYLATLIEKSGALGPWTIPLSIIQSAQWGDNPIVSQVPIVDLADATLLEGNWTRPIPLINNID